LRETLESILGQSFGDFELIISDNASTDATAEICGAFADRDPRIRYLRQQQNLGAAPNFNYVFEQARGRYFKWQGHDDPLTPGLLEHCVAALERDPTVVLSFGKTIAIDEHGRPMRPSPLLAFMLRPRPGLGSPDAVTRFFSCVLRGHPPGIIFGVMRRDVLARTPLLGAYISADLPLLAELVLRGRFAEVPVIQHRRYHSQQGHRSHASRRARESWFDPRRGGKLTFPRLRLLREHMRAISRITPDGRLRASCYVAVMLWFLKEVLIIQPAKVMLRSSYLYLRPR
jgi:glycosyltransferase involved in cell wall biosynthesis